MIHTPRQRSGSPHLPYRLLPVKNQTLGDEGYHIIVGKDSILIEANSERGFFYATKSLSMMLVALHDSMPLMHCEITGLSGLCLSRYAPRRVPAFLP